MDRIAAVTHSLLAILIVEGELIGHAFQRLAGNEERALHEEGKLYFGLGQLPEAVARLSPLVERDGQRSMALVNAGVLVGLVLTGCPGTSSQGPAPSPPAPASRLPGAHHRAPPAGRSGGHPRRCARRPPEFPGC